MKKMRTTKQRGSSYQVDLSYVDPQGVKRRLRYSYPTEEEAKVTRLRMELAIEEGRDPRGEAGRRRPDVGVTPETLGELRHYCLQWVWSGTRGEDTAISNSGRIVDQIGAHIPIRGITTGTIRIAVKGLQAEGLAPSTINRILGSLGKMLSVSLEEKWIDSKPKIPKVEEEAKEARFLYEDELDSLFVGLGDISQDAHDLAVFLLWTGCRVGEALSLEWGDIDLDAGRVTFTKTKTNHNRTVPVPARALKVLERRFSKTHPPFTIVQDTFGKQWNRAKQAIGMDDSEVTPHTLRHTCASRLVMAGVSLYEVAKWLGHTSIATTQVYAHLAPDHLKGAQDVLELKYGNEGEEDWDCRCSRQQDNHDDDCPDRTGEPR